MEIDIWLSPIKSDRGRGTSDQWLGEFPGVPSWRRGFEADRGYANPAMSFLKGNASARAASLGIRLIL